VPEQDGRRIHMCRLIHVRPPVRPHISADGNLGGTAFVAMMQSSDLGKRDDLARSRSVYWPGVRAIPVDTASFASSARLRSISAILHLFQTLASSKIIRSQ